MRNCTWLSESTLVGLASFGLLVGCGSDESLGGGLPEDGGGGNLTDESTIVTTDTGGAAGGDTSGAGSTATAPADTGGASGRGGVALGGAGGGTGGYGGGAPSDALCQYQTSSASGNATKTFDFSIVQPDGSSLSCTSTLSADGGTVSPAWPGPATGEITGTVNAVDDTRLSVDTCESGTNCATGVYQFTVTSKGLTLAGIPIGRKVQVSWWIYNGGMACQRMLVVTDAASADVGTTVPAVWLAGADALTQAPISAPFSFTRKELFCNPNPSLTQGCGGNDVSPDDYAFQFVPVTVDPPVAVATDQTDTLTLTLDGSTIQHLTVHTLRCFQTARCDDYSNWAWWAVGQADSNGRPE